MRQPSNLIRLGKTSCGCHARQVDEPAGDGQLGDDAEEAEVQEPANKKAGDGAGKADAHDGKKADPGEAGHYEQGEARDDETDTRQTDDVNDDSHGFFSVRFRSCVELAGAVDGNAEEQAGRPPSVGLQPSGADAGKVRTVPRRPPSPSSCSGIVHATLAGEFQQVGAT
jgi:hypothetical protein